MIASNTCAFVELLDRCRCTPTIRARVSRLDLAVWLLQVTGLFSGQNGQVTQRIGWKGRSWSYLGRTTKLGLRVARCVCVGGLTWSFLDCLGHRQLRGVNRAKKEKSMPKKENLW